MRASRTIRYGSHSNFLDGRILIRRAGRVFTEEDGLRLPVDKPDRCVFPVADVVAEAPAHNGVAEVKGVEVKVKRVDDAAGFRYPDYDTGGRGHA